MGLVYRVLNLDDIALNATNDILCKRYYGKGIKNNDSMIDYLRLLNDHITEDNVQYDDPWISVTRDFYTAVQKYATTGKLKNIDLRPPIAVIENHYFSDIKLKQGQIDILKAKDIEKLVIDCSTDKAIDELIEMHIFASRDGDTIKKTFRNKFSVADDELLVFSSINKKDILTYLNPMEYDFIYSIAIKIDKELIMNVKKFFKDYSKYLTESERLFIDLTNKYSLNYLAANSEDFYKYKDALEELIYKLIEKYNELNNTTYKQQVSLPGVFYKTRRQEISEKVKILL